MTCAQSLLPLRVALLVKRGQRLDERDAGLDHGGELPGEQNEIGFFDRPCFLPTSARRRFLLQGEDHQATTHEAGDGIVSR